MTDPTTSRPVAEAPTRRRAPAERPARTRAIVIGASMAGLATARALSDHVDQVTVLERDALPPGHDNRRGVPQGRHAHLLLAAGQEQLEHWFPGLVDELVGAGAVTFPIGRGRFHQAGGFRAEVADTPPMVSLSRPLLESTVRRRLTADRRGVTIIDGVSVEGLLIEDGRVVGIRADGRDHRADLVVDCSGRNTRFLGQLAGEGFPEPEVSAITIRIAYGTRVLRRDPNGRRLRPTLIVNPPQAGGRGGVMAPMEDDHWIVTLAGYHGDEPPTDPEAFLAFARSLSAPDIADLLADCEALTPVMTHKLPTSQRRRVERLRRVPAGFVVLGDAICSFNPVYGQGMTSATLQAAELGSVVAARGVSAPDLAKRFYKRAARVVDVPWKIAAGADFADPRTSGPKPRGTDLTNRYLTRVLLASHTSPEVNRRLLAVQNLLARPESLMTPGTVLEVLRAARRSPVRTGVTPASNVRPGRGAAPVGASDDHRVPDRV